MEFWLVTVVPKYSKCSKIQSVQNLNLCHTVVVEDIPLFYRQKVKWSRYSLGLARRVGRGIALLFHDRGTRRGWMVSSTPRPFYPREVPGTHFTGGWVGSRAGLDWRKISSPPGFDPEPSSPVTLSLYRLRYRAHSVMSAILKWNKYILLLSQLYFYFIISKVAN